MEIQKPKRLESGLLRVSKRLTEISRLISATRLIDIGTDHGLLPIYALEQEIVSKAIGGDKSELALGNALANRMRSFVEDQLELICSDGLEKINPEQGDCIILAGMGGLSISKILNDPKIEQSSQIITQANTEIPLVRAFLSNRGWKIEQETMILHQKHCYTTISWRKGEQKLTEKEVYLGKIFLKERPKIWLDWIAKEKQRIEKIRTIRGGKLSVIQKQIFGWLREET